MLVIFCITAVVYQVYGGSSDVSISGSPCQPGDTQKIPHPGQCHLYYDCSLQDKTAEWLEMNMVECKYPDLFDADTLQCERFTSVTCGDRYEPVNGCEYKANQCNGPNCRPCFVDFPECNRLPDGPNPIPIKLGSPFFAMCLKGRFLGEMQCPPDDTGRPMIFEATSRNCVKAQHV